MMNGPFLVRVAPVQLRNSLWSRLHRNKQQNWLPLYESATLSFAPPVKMELVSDYALSNRVAFTGIHELELTRCVVELARRSGTFIDIGANLGYFSPMWAACNPANKNCAIEASPRAISRFCNIT
jgi:hypothetical protein